MSIVLLLFSAIQIRLLYIDKPSIIISFLCFDLVFSELAAGSRGKRAVTLENIRNLFRLISDSLAKVEIYIKKLYLPEISNIQFFNGIKNSVLSALVAYISIKTGKIKTEEHFMLGNDSSPMVDVTISGRILPIGISLLRSYYVNNR